MSPDPLLVVNLGESDNSGVDISVCHVGQEGDLVELICSFWKRFRAAIYVLRIDILKNVSKLFRVGLLGLGLTIP